MDWFQQVAASPPESFRGGRGLGNASAAGQRLEFSSVLLGYDFKN